MRVRRHAGAVAVLLVLGLVGCAPDRPEGAVEDATLFAAIEDLDGVISSSVTYKDELGRSSQYSGRVEVSSDADARCVLYQTLGLLEQGRPSASSGLVTVVQGGERLEPADLPFRIWSSLEPLATSGPEPTVPDCSAIDLGGTATGTPAP